MTENLKTPLKKRMIYGLIIFFVLAASCYGYYQSAFPEVRCEYGLKDHLESPDSASDCYTCHVKSTPKIAQDWYESKHGVMLVKCFVCHGQPDGKGSIPYAVNPDVNTTCRKCHDPSIKKMEEKYGIEPQCNTCHPFHNNSLHHKAYTKTKAKKTID
jgi:hypothetical protein